MIRIVPATSHSSSHMPGVVGLGVVVVVDVDDVLEISFVLGISDIFTDATVAVRAASSNFSMEIGVVDGVGHPVNSVVALKFVSTIVIRYNTILHHFDSSRAKRVVTHNE